MRTALNPADPFLRYKKQLPQAPPGLSALDMMGRGYPGPQIPRTYTHSPYQTNTQVYQVEAGHILAAGADVTIGPDGIAHHLRVGEDERYGGVVVQMLEGDRVLVHTKGIMDVRIPGVSVAIGKTVYATVPNQYNLLGGVPIGRLLHIRPEGPCSVLFVKGGKPEEGDWNRARDMYPSR